MRHTLPERLGDKEEQQYAAERYYESNNPVVVLAWTINLHGLRIFTKRPSAMRGFGR